MLSGIPTMKALNLKLKQIYLVSIRHPFSFVDMTVEVSQSTTCITLIESLRPGNLHMKLKKGSDLINKAYCRFNQSGPGVDNQKGALTSGTACIGLSWTISVFHLLRLP